MTKITLCGSPGCKCPVVNFTNEGVIITDDYGGKVTLTTSQAILLAQAVRENRKEEN